MSTTQMKDLDWMVVSRTMRGGKLAWYYNQLTRAGIAAKIVVGVSGLNLIVTKDSLIEAMEILNGQIGLTQIGFEYPVICFDDLPNDHPFFETEAAQDTRWFEPSAQELMDSVMTKDEEMHEAFDPITKTLVSLCMNLPGDSPAEIIMALPFYLGSNQTVMVNVVGSTSVDKIGLKPIETTGYDILKDEYEVYVKFIKAADFYLYSPVKRLTLVSLLVEVANNNVGIETASVGSLVHQLLKVPANDGELGCYRKDNNGNWVLVARK